MKSYGAFWNYVILRVFIYVLHNASPTLYTEVCANMTKKIHIEIFLQVS